MSYIKGQEIYKKLKQYLNEYPVGKVSTFREIAKEIGCSYQCAKVNTYRLKAEGAPIEIEAHGMQKFVTRKENPAVSVPVPA